VHQPSELVDAGNRLADKSIHGNSASRSNAVLPSARRVTGKGEQVFSGTECGVSQLAGVSLRPKWPGARRDEGAYPQRSVTEEQRSPRPFSAQPSGPPVFSPPASLLAPHRPLTGLLVARA